MSLQIQEIEVRESMNYYRYIARRMLDISYIRGRMQKLFSVLSDKDYDLLQDLLVQAENVLRKYL